MALNLLAIVFAVNCLVVVFTQETVNLGILLPEDNKYPFNIARVTPAIDLAIDTITRTKLLPNHVIITNIRNSRCSETYGPVEAIDLYAQGKVNVFIGPVCNYAVAPVARFAPFWSIPVISAGALVKAFDNKAEYGTLTRVQAPYGKLAQFVFDVTQVFNWSKIGMLYNNNNRLHSEHFFMMEPIFMKFKQAGLTPWYKQFDENNLQTDEITNLLQQASTETRIILLCASPDSVRDIMIRASDMQFDDGEYVFLNIDLFSSKNDIEMPWFRADDSYERNEKAKQAYNALLTITLRKPESVEYKTFSRKVKERAKEMYNVSYGEGEVNSFVGAFHDAVIIYALALNETLAANKSITNGAQITKRMWNRTFQGITGTVSIDENGDRNGDFSLLDMNQMIHRFEVVANYNGKDQIYTPVERKQIQWAGGRTAPPLDIPKCGFDGLRCNRDVGVPTAPVNVKALTRTFQHIFVSWDPPLNTNGHIIKYKLRYYMTGETTVHEIESLILRWDPLPEESRNGIITGYRIRYNIRFRWRVHTVTTNGNMSAYVLTNLNEDTQYQVKIAAVNVNGSGPYTNKVTAYTLSHGLNESRITAVNVNGSGPYTNKIRDYTLRDSLDESRVPESPSAVRVTPYATSIRVAWTSPVPESKIMVRGYVLGYGREIVDMYQEVLGPDIHVYEINNLEPNSQYVITVRAYNNMGQSQPKFQTAQTLQEEESRVPEPPSAVRVTPYATSIRVAWTSPAPESQVMVRGYVLGYGRKIAYWHQEVLGPDIHVYEINNLEPNAQYVITVRAYNNMGQSQPKYQTAQTLKEEVIEPVTPMMPPVGLKAHVVSSSMVLLTWTDMALGISQQNIDNRYYNVKYTALPTSSNNFEFINSTRLNCLIYNLDPHTEYQFSVKVVKGQRESTWGMSLITTTDEAD